MSIDELKLKIKDTPISQVIGYYLPLVRKGPQVLARCPFHDDNDPSMHVNDSKNMFMCFVDNIGGDAINFVMRYKNLEFIDALKDICSALGWNFEDFIEEKKKSPRDEMARRILSKASQLYRKVAQSSHSSIFTDFLKQRGISDETATTFALGMAPGNNALSLYLSSIPEEKERAFALQMAKEIGLIRESKHQNQDHYDTFRDRIVFPIWDQFGQVTGFTTRATRADQKAKYMNSIDSFVFNKRNILYGLHLAKNFIRSRDALILVEGNMDQIALFQNGFEHSVAIMGVALGEHSLRKIKALTSNVYLALDSDDAGLKAMERINKQFLEAGIIPKYLNFSPHKDPDEFISAEGILAMQEKIEKAQPFLDALVDQKLPKQIPEIADQKLIYLREIFEILSPLGDTLAATERVLKASSRLGIRSGSEQILKNYHAFLAEISSQKKPFRQNQEPQEKFEREESLNKNEQKQEVNYVERSSSLDRAEKTLIHQLVLHPDCLMHKKGRELLDLVSHFKVKEFLLGLKDLVYEIDESEYPSMAQALLDKDDYPLELKEVAGAALYKYRHAPLERKVLDRLVLDLERKLQEEQLRSMKEEIKKRKSECETTEELNELMQELITIEKKINDLKTRTPKNF